MDCLSKHSPWTNSVISPWKLLGFAGRERAAMGLHIEFIRVCLGKTPHFPKPPRPVICILIVSAFTSWSAPAQPSDWNIMTLMMLFSPPSSRFLPHLLSRLSIEFLFHHHGFLTSFAVSTQSDFTSPFHHTCLIQCNETVWLDIWKGHV